MKYETDYQKIPIAWVKRIFERLENIYENFQEKFPLHLRELDLLVWSNALQGLTSQEIKNAILKCKNDSSGIIPTPIAFFHLANDLKIHKTKGFVLRETFR